MLRVYLKDILRVYISKHIACSHFLFQFTRNNIFWILTKILDRNFENMSETFLAETFSTKTFCE